MDPSFSTGFVPLAIVGFSLRFPQDADTPEGFWRMLEEKRSLMTEWPEDRMKLDAFYHCGTDRTEQTTYPRGAHFLKQDLGEFDALFFGISPVEAMSMDPQQRILLEVTYHALESAGMPMERVSGSKTGVYGGSMGDDYKHIVLKDLDDVPRYATTGHSMSSIANRISWFYNFVGPSVTLDSACSSSLMAFDFACQGLRNGDCNMAVVAGCSLALAAENVVALNNMSLLSRDGLCFAFDDRANGYSKGEGVGVVLVKRLNDAIRDGDTIRAIVRSTGSNQDGYTPVLTQPSAESQALLIRETYEKAGLKLSETRYIEAHGTGTPLGDTAEATAIVSAFKSTRPQDNLLVIGALKSNIGHLEGASGVAALIKTIMVLEKGIIPPNVNFEKLNGRIDHGSLNIKYPTECTRWPSSGLRRASVSSFGIGGSKTHVVLDDAYHYLLSRGLEGNHETSPSPINPTHPQGPTDGPNGADPAGNTGTHPDTDADAPDDATPKLLIFSANDEDGINRLSAAYQAFFEKNIRGLSKDPSYLDRLASTLATRRSSLTWKSSAVVQSSLDLCNLERLMSKPKMGIKKGEICFVFTGQGAQYQNMGAQLMAYSTFRSAIKKFDEHLADMGCTWSVTDMLQIKGSESCIDEPEYSQPMTTALQIGMLELLESFKITPAVVIGHSSGEIAAAYAAGALSLKSACTVIYYRGKYASALKSSPPYAGGMMAVDLPADAMQAFLTKRGFARDKICIACVNSPDNVTISGDAAALDQVGRELESEKIRIHRLNIGVAYHSPQVELIAAENARKLSDLVTGPAKAKRPRMISSVTGKYMDPEDVCQAKYWTANLVSPVQFSRAVLTMLSSATTQTRKPGSGMAETIRDIVEIGPRAALRRPIQACLQHIKQDSQVTYHATLERSIPSNQTILRLSGGLYSHGHPVDVSKVNNTDTLGHDGPQAITNLPSYPFDHSKRYWHESPLSKQSRLRKSAKLELLGNPVADWNALQPRWHKFLDLNETPWIGHHKVNDTIIYPATGMVVMAIEGITQMADNRREITGYHIRDAVFSAPIVINDSDRAEVQLSLQPDQTHSSDYISAFEYFIYSRAKNGDWSENSRGLIQAEYSTGDTDRDREIQQRENAFYCRQYDDALQACRHKVDTKDMYDILKSNGLKCGSSFQTLDNLAWDGDGRATGDIHCFQWTPQHSQHSRQKHVAHPVTLDAAGQLMWVALSNGARDALFNGFAVTRIKSAWIAGSGVSFPGNSQLQAVSTADHIGGRRASSSIFAIDSNRNLKFRISNLEVTALGASKTSVTIAEPRRLCFEMDYKPDVDLMSRSQLESLTGIDSTSEEDPTTFYQELELALVYFITKASEEGLLSETSMTGSEPHIRKYAEWLKLQLRNHRNGQLPHSHPTWDARIRDVESMKQLIGRVEEANDEGKLFMTVGQNLGGILTGAIDPLQFLFQSGLAGKAYQDRCNRMTCCGRLTKYLDALSHKLPQMKVLEIGAGTGSLTRHVLRALTPRSPDGSEGVNICFGQYVYTDISEYFFEQARHEFAAFKPKMKFAALDVEKEIESQGYEPATFDLVVAGWVLHATRDLAATLRNVHRLLRPGGKLVLLELTEPTIFRSGFVFGTLPGWWLGKEKEREWSPCASSHRWTGLLVESGFKSVDIVLPDFESPLCQESNILIATNGQQKSTPQPKPVSRDIAILHNTESGLQRTVADLLRREFTSHGAGAGACNIYPITDPSLATLPRGSTLVFLVELDRPYLSTLNKGSYEALQTLISRAGNISWVACSDDTDTHSPELHLVRGLARVLTSEKPSVPFVTLSFKSVGLEPEFYAQRIPQVIPESLPNGPVDNELEYVEQNGLLLINRVFESPKLDREIHSKTHPTIQHQPMDSSTPRAITIRTQGLLDSFYWEEDASYKDPLAADEIEISVGAVGVNMRDLLVALGRFDGAFGCECAGTVARVGTNCHDFKPGDRVCVAALGCVRTHFRCNHQLAVKIPDDMTVEEAASLPAVGVTVHYSLVTFADLKKGETILIHAAAGGTGQMAVQMAQHIGAEIYVTVGSEKKRALMREVYGLPDSHIFYSRDASFSRDIYRATNGRGVDVVLNSLAGDLLLASWECIAPRGRFIELGKTDIDQNSKLPMSYFRKNVGFQAIAVDFLMCQHPLFVNKALKAVMDLVSQKAIKVVSPLCVHPVSEVETVFRTMQSGKNFGKTVLSFTPSDQVPTLREPRHSCQLDASATYVIAGGLGGLGRSAARWMCRQGARHLILLSRSGPASPAAQALVADLRGKGVTIETPKCDVSNSASLAEALQSCSHMPPIRGCLHAVVELQDSLFENMSWEQWSTTVRSKVDTSLNLHQQLPKGLSFFVMLSSVNAIVGYMSQANYAAANTYQAALAHHRLSLGEKAVSIYLGWVGDIGLVAESERRLKENESFGGLAQVYESEILALLDKYCHPDFQIEKPQDAQPILGLVTPAQYRLRGRDVPDWISSRPLLRSLERPPAGDTNGPDAGGRSSGDGRNRDWPAQLARAKSSSEATDIVVDALIRKFSKITSTEQRTIDRTRPFNIYGMDSLLAVELRNWINAAFKVGVTNSDIIGQSSIEQLAEDVASRSPLRQEGK